MHFGTAAGDLEIALLRGQHGCRPVAGGTHAIGAIPFACVLHVKYPFSVRTKRETLGVTTCWQLCSGVDGGHQLAIILM